MPCCRAYTIDVVLSKQEGCSEVVDKLTELAERYPTRGFDEYYLKIHREGLIWNRKRVLRVYREMKLSLQAQEAYYKTRTTAIRDT
ncbi:hypothetical protein [Christiangramia sp. 3-2217-3z]|uniref:hypothetical protein n=1 Tax=Christiangramia sp. 3-2217-3z TaxID=3417564 RepID=UPI003EBDC57D